MKRLYTASALGLALLFASGGVGFALDLIKGQSAYDKRDFATALKEWRPLAEQGNAIAQYQLGKSYLKGQGLIQDYGQAAHWFRLAAEQGHAPSMVYLGWFYRNGYGVPRDDIRGHMWYNIAASRGDADGIVSRDNVTHYMTPTDISNAQAMARACVAKHYKGC